MKKKNGLKTAHWILLSIAALSIAIGIIICIVAKVDYDKLIPIIISAVSIIVTVVLDAVGAKQEKQEKLKVKNILEHAKVGEDATVGEEDAPSTGSYENIANDLEVKSSLHVGNKHK